MSSGVLVALELLIVLGAGLFLAFRELRLLRRLKREREAQAAPADDADPPP